MYIDNTNSDQSTVSYLSFGERETIKGIKFTLSKVLRDIDSTYHKSEVLQMLKCNAIIEFNENTEVGQMILNSSLNVVKDRPIKEALNTSKSAELFF